ncbi:putative disease resistance RPP13-like protein 1 [Morella rubra]|uniref:Putative disease resistance RPP13-like protein 1 n=1 Tax=Morella rubra TaxID=262757 RepID=A0A6A1UY38_9ROSI|nr:putative disease resistance RPP13-like protein 1 [Morella rubra]
MEDVVHHTRTLLTTLMDRRLFAAALIQVLLELLVSRELLNFARREGLRRKLEKLKNTLSIIQAVVDDAEGKQHTDKAVQKWLDDLVDLAYDAED